MVVASIRDILQPKSRIERNQETCDLIDQYYDRVLVHGDENIARLGDSFDLADQIAHKVAYSGYIVNPSISPDDLQKSDEVLVSAGGSATGLKLLQAAIAARPRSSFADNPWRILVSPQIAEADFQQLQMAPRGVIVERNRADFQQLLRCASLSISQAGYNTVTDILNSPTAAVVVPFSEAGEIEQTLRARLLDQNKRVVMLDQERLTAISLASAMQQAGRLNPSLQVDLNGSRNSVRLIRQWLDERTQST